MSDSTPSFSLVVLCYRSEGYAREFVDRLTDTLETSAIESYELILVGNYLPGTGDPTPDIVKELAAGNPRIKVSAEPKEGWLGWDMKCGFDMAEGDYIGVIDGDGQMPVSDVASLYQLIRRERYDLVKTFRITRGDGLGRRLLSNVYNKLFHLFFPGLQARDMNSKPKIMTREAYGRMELVSDDWFIDAEMMIEARRLRLRVGELPTGFLGLTGRRSFVGLGAILEFIGNMIRYRMREWRR